MLIPVAVSGPEFVIVTVKRRVPPVAMLVGADLMRERSAFFGQVRVVLVAVELELFEEFGSKVVADTDAVFAMVPPHVRVCGTSRAIVTPVEEPLRRSPVVQMTFEPTMEQVLVL